MGTKERSLSEPHSNDVENVAAMMSGGRTDVSRRGFLGGAGLTAVGAAVGASIPFGANLSTGFIPAATAQDAKPAAPAAAPAPAPAAPAAAPMAMTVPGKDPGLIMLGDKPLNAETPAALMNEATTPASKFFVRTHGTIPDAPSEPDKWVLKIDGEVEKPMDITLGELKSKFKAQTRRMVLECAGNGRSYFTPPAKGNQWTVGGAGASEWTGVRLGDVLKAAGLKSTAVFTAHYGTDAHLSGDPTKQTLSRGMPIKKAMDENTMLVWAQNGEPLTAPHGAPLRLVVPGWVGSLSHKWLNKLTIRDKVHDGQGMKAPSYALPNSPMVPGAEPNLADFRIMEAMPTRSIITAPANGAKLAAGTREIELAGAAWGHENDIEAVEVSRDFGVSWKKAKFSKPKNKYDWVRWTATEKLPSDGYYEMWVRAKDSSGAVQPFIAGNWNPSGYGANAYHRIAVLVG